MRRRLVIADSVRTAAGPSGNAVLVRDGRVEAIGRAEELRSANLREVQYPGSVITAGLVDAHFHPLGYTAALMRLNLDGAGSIADLKEMVGQAAAELAPAAALIGTRFDDQSIGRMPTRLDLDEATGGRPAVIYRYCGHVAVANTAALELASITSNTSDPVGGSIDRDDRGNPTGVLRETAIALVAGPVGSRTGDLSPSEVLAAMQGLASLGLTSLGAIIDLSGDLWCGVGNELDLLTEIAADLPLRMAVLAITDVPAKLHEAADRLDTAGPMVRFLGVKQFADGSFGGHTAAMHEPYSDKATTGTMRIGPGTGRMARTALQMGGRVAIHAIGDRANAAVLDLFETLITEGADPDSLRIEHVSVISKPDVERMADLGVTAVVQPAFLMSEADWLEDRIGHDRMDQTYAFRSLQEAGVPLAGSSDCPVEPPSPWWGMAAARDRAGLTPAQQLSAADAFAMFTAGSAKAIGSPTLEVGAPCDLTVVDRDPVEVDPDSVRQTAVLATWIEGEPVALPSDPVVWEANSPAG
ncbi:MAG: amidohydrolase [Acidimicrobiia bacterium]|nr:amidohydrolase [Acidimicrobiia bacterium]